MTREEMNRLIKKFGGLNLINALKVSIIKYKELPEYWEEMPRPHFPSGTNCALCNIYGDKECKGCPLEKIGKCGFGSLYEKIADCINYNREEKNFNKLCGQMVRILERKLEKALKEAENKERMKK